jgi:hypothetical protein
MVFSEGKDNDCQGLLAVDAGRGVDVAIGDEGEEVVGEVGAEGDVEVGNHDLHSFRVVAVQVLVHVPLADEVPLLAELGKQIAGFLHYLAELRISHLLHLHEPLLVGVVDPDALVGHLYLQEDAAEGAVAEELSRNLPLVYVDRVAFEAQQHVDHVEDLRNVVPIGTILLLDLESLDVVEDLVHEISVAQIGQGIGEFAEQTVVVTEYLRNKLLCAVVLEDVLRKYR